MSDLWQGILIGAALSIPIGILVNVFSDRLGKWLEGRSATAVERRKAQDEVFQRSVDAMAKDRSILYICLLESLIGIAYTLGTFGVSALVLFAAGTVIYEIAGLGYIILLVGVIRIMSIARRALGTIASVRALRGETEIEGV